MTWSKQKNILKKGNGSTKEYLNKAEEIEQMIQQSDPEAYDDRGV